MTPEEARTLGELRGKFLQADARLAEWPTQNDEKVVQVAEGFLQARKEYHQMIKRLGKESGQ
jgi:hypothetical protein